MSTKPPLALCSEASDSGDSGDSGMFTCTKCEQVFPLDEEAVALTSLDPNGYIVRHSFCDACIEAESQKWAK